MHMFLHHNGNRDKPQVFANLLKNANKHDLKACFIDMDRMEIGKKFSHSLNI